MKSIWKDLTSGALPLREVPSFLAWRFGRPFWAAVLVIVILAVALGLRP